MVQQLLCGKTFYIIINDDDKVYSLLRNGILEMQDKAAVFISEKLKKMQIHDMPKFSVGVSVSHDLLQLELVSDTMSTKQLAEILAKYDSKKKYYRLKNGDFLNIDDSIHELADLKDSLSLSSAQIAAGTITVFRLIGHSIWKNWQMKQQNMSLHKMLLPCIDPAHA
jgi:hypothetical protein